MVARTDRGQRFLEMPAELQEKWGYPAITEEMRAKFLGLNLARLAKIKPTKRVRKAALKMSPWLTPFCRPTERWYTAGTMLNRFATGFGAALACVLACASASCTRCNPDFIGLNVSVEQGALAPGDANAIDRLYFSAVGPQTIDRYVTPKSPPFKFPVVVGVPTGCIAGGTYEVTVTGYGGDTPIGLGRGSLSISDQKGPDTSITLSSSVPTQ